MPKVYKSKTNKLIVTIPYDVIDALGIKDGDDLDFLKYGENTYIVAKKNDLVNLLTKGKAEEPKPSYRAAVVPSTKGGMTIDPRELAVLKKLDTLRYNERTSTKVNTILNTSEKEILQTLIKKGMVSLFKKAGEKEMKYGIQKSVYDNFLYRKNMANPQPSAAQPNQSKSKTQQIMQANTRIGGQRAWESKLNENDAYVDILESKGFVVLNNEAEASMVSSALEESIRQGLVVGTRAFNKKFYIGLRGFINKHAAKILKLIDQKNMDVEDIAKEMSLEEDGVRTILYVLSESGDVTEVRRDIFRAA
ncbi:MAG: AbrB/MazE/SpoVT family DNA-binding domain-containing protein [Candidatus Micrarchaeaceae archaeon]|jgi:bifunctional DNA-binding transcriptional regulator/antitoxin component of YhaV-PrlF toxin-antitoxin module